MEHQHVLRVASFIQLTEDGALNAQRHVRTVHAVETVHVLTLIRVSLVLAQVCTLSMSNNLLFKG